MVRFVVYLFLSIFVISIARALIKAVLQGLASLFQTQQSSPARQQPQPPSMPLTGELKRDPVCGTYTVEAHAIRQTIKGETLYFCSSRCRDEYLAASRR